MTDVRPSDLTAWTTRHWVTCGNLHGDSAEGRMWCSCGSEWTDESGGSDD